MALMEIQEYIARDANNLGQYILVFPEKEPSNTIIIIYIVLIVIIICRS